MVKKFKRDDIIARLRNAPRRITFTKSDGSERVMLCTLEKAKVPKVDEDYNNLPGESVIAWDLEKNGWRTFYVDTVKAIEAA
jgi:hypothetical protein